jgi:outer membrane protein assembly factor BamB
MYFIYGGVAVLLALVYAAQAWFVNSRVKAASAVPSAGVTPASPRPTPTHPPSLGIDELLMPITRDDGGTDLLVSLSGDGNLLGLFDGTSKRLSWKSGSFSKRVYASSVWFGDGKVFVVEDTRLSALNKSDGTTLWQTSLTAEIGSSCVGCLRVIKQRVVALQKNGSLQAFDSKTGQLVWSQELEKTPSRLSVALDLLALTWPINKKATALGLAFLDPVDGRVVRVIDPSCLNHAFHRPEHVAENSPLLFGPGDKVMVVMFGFFSQCAQAWDVSSGKKLWSTYIPQWESTWSHPVFGEHAVLYKTQDGALASLDSSTGELKKLLGEDKKYQFHPVTSIGKTIVLKAAPQWDANKLVLWGVDGTTGERRWQFPLSAKDLSMTDRSDRTWSLRPTPAGLAVVQTLNESHLSVDLLNPQTGVSSGQKQLTFASRLRDVTLLDSVAWVHENTGLTAVNLPAGTVGYHLP